MIVKAPVEEHYNLFANALIRVLCLRFELFLHVV